jgi:hypothetical protein
MGYASRFVVESVDHASEDFTSKGGRISPWRDAVTTQACLRSAPTEEMEKERDHGSTKIADAHAT